MDIDGLMDAAEQGNLLITQSLVETIKYEDSILMIAYYLAKKRALKLTPNLTLREDLNVDVLKTRFKNVNDKSLVEQGKESEVCANYLYQQFDTTSTTNITLFAFVLCKLNRYENFCDFILHREDINFHFKAKDGKTMLHVAAKKGNVNITKLLLDYCDINNQDLAKKTPLHYAVKKRHYDIVKLLLDHQASIRVKDHSGQTVLHYVSPGQYGNEKFFNLILSYDKNSINHKYKHQTLLYYSVQNNYAETVQYLLENGANPFIPSRVKKTNNYEKVYEVPFTLASKLKFDNVEDQINNYQIILLLNRYMLKN